MSRQVPTSRLQKALAIVSERICSRSMNGYGRLWEAYAAVGDVLYRLSKQGINEPDAEVSEDTSKRVSLTATLLQSTVIVEQAITCGQYWAASVLLRQHMEALARVIHIREGKPMTEKAPP
ncbi:MAG: hypothetical protein HQ559_06705, partial [Lentisphaerae bacterium]|nr:hypothetical protein [Lentisphaerota bacterium]